MKKKFIKIVVAASLVLIATAIASTRIEAKSPKQSKHDRIVKFWTNARIARAIPRDFVRNPKTRSFKPIQWKNSPGTIAAAAKWSNGGEVSTSTGKVFFTLGGYYYVCSASVITENVAKQSLVLTAGHCAFDEVHGVFADNWMFIPEYYAQPATLNPNESFCAKTTMGCWTASALVVSKDYADAGAFNDVAVLHDFAFAVMGAGGTSGDDDLSQKAGSHPVSFSKLGDGVDTWIFGYPAANRYKGNTLMYCNGLLGLDSRMLDATYSLPCSLTAGSSGGPWFHPFASGGTGTQFSVNSYTYGGSKAMYGPMLSTEAEGMFVAAKSTNGNILYELP